MASYVERDWQEAANCIVDVPEDISFISRPTPDEEERWGRTCARCGVFRECLMWAERNDVSGVFVAGEWRE